MVSLTNDIKKVFDKKQGLSKEEAFAYLVEEIRDCISFLLYLASLYDSPDMEDVIRSKLARLLGERRHCPSSQQQLVRQGEKATLEFIIHLLDRLYEKTGNRFHVVLRDGDNMYLVGEATDDWVGDAEVGRYGECENCNIKVCSWAKNAYCPVCGGDVYLV